MKRKLLETAKMTRMNEVEKRLDRIEKIVGVLVDSLDELREYVRREKAKDKPTKRERLEI